MIGADAALGRVRPALAAFALAALACGPAAAEDSAAWLSRAANAARTLSYVGTVVYQHGGRIETSRIVHWNDAGAEYEKLVNLEGPPREVIRSQGEVRCYYPEAKVVRIEPLTFRNSFPSLSPQQQKSLAEFYDLRKAETGRVAGLDVQAWVFEPRDGLRYGHKFWVDTATGLVVKARVQDERSEPIEQFAFSDITIGAKIDRDMVKPTFAAAPPEWRVREGRFGNDEHADTGWTVSRVPPGFSRVLEAFRNPRGKRAPVAHLMYSDGLVSVSVFIEPAGGATHKTGFFQQQDGINVYVRQFDDYLVTVFGEAPGATVRQIAYSVARR